MIDIKQYVSRNSRLSLPALLLLTLIGCGAENGNSRAGNDIGSEDGDTSDIGTDDSNSASSDSNGSDDANNGVNAGNNGNNGTNSSETDVVNSEHGSGIERLTFTENQDELNDHVTGEGTFHISNNGRYLLFTTTATNVVDDDGPIDSFEDVYLRDTLSGSVTKISRAAENRVNDALSYAEGISDDGRYALFTSFSRGIHPAANGSNQVYLYDALSSSVELISRDLAGEVGRGNSNVAFISSDGSTVLFSSHAANIVDDFGVEGSVMLAYDVQSRTLSRVGDKAGRLVDVSSDARYVLFVSEQPYVFDRETQSLTMIEHEDALNLSISDDGNYIAFTTAAFDSLTRIDLQLQTELVVRINALVPPGSDTGFNRRVRRGQISGDGKYVLYDGIIFDGEVPLRSDNLFWDIYAMDLDQAEAILISRGIDQSNQQPGGLSGGNGRSSSALFYNEGRSILFHSEASNLVPEDTKYRDDLFAVPLFDD